VRARQSLGTQRCNIGPAEIARRRWIAIALTIATLAFAWLLWAAGVPHLARALLWPVAAAAGVTWLQVVRKFCVRFGATGVENYGNLGEEMPVDPTTREADARRAAELIGEGVLAGLLLTVAFVNLPV
jgi:hypothetical protein